MAVKIELTSPNVGIITQQLNGLLRAGEDFTPLMANIAAALADSVESAFAMQRDPNTGQPWQPLSEAYQQRRAKQGRDGKILQLSGALAASVQSNAGKDFAEVGSNKVYAAIHQQGGTTAMRPALAAIPARSFLGIDEVAKEEILDLLRDHLAQALKR